MNTQLNQPYLPQMKDGVITQGDLSVDNEIVIEILPYHGVSIGDFIELHFGNVPTYSVVIEDVTASPIALFPVNASLVPDGIWPVWYEITDVAQNSSSSPIGWAVVNRNDTGSLAAPVFTDADSQKLIINDESIQQNKGTHVAVSPQHDISENDYITLIFYVTDKSGGELIPNSQFSTTHKVTEENVNNGIKILVPEACIIVTDEGVCNARYLLEKANTNSMISSLTGQANLSLDNLVSLSAPLFIDARNGWLTPTQVQSGIHVLAVWSSPREGDKITMFLSGYDDSGLPVIAADTSLTKTVSARDENEGNVLFTFDSDIAELIGNGRMSAYYVVNENNISVAASVNIDMNSTNTLPPPVFSQATGNELHEDIINQAGAVLIDVDYDTMAVGDIVTLYVTGQDSDGQNVPAATWSSSVLSESQDIEAGKIIFNLPLTNALSVGDNGILNAYYSVTIHNNSGVAFSLPVNTKLVSTMDSTIKLIMTAGAPIYGNTMSITPVNRGYITGPAGMNVRIGCSSPGIIRESGSNVYGTTLDQKGKASFSVYSGATGVVDILVFNSQDPNEKVSGITEFDLWTFDINAPMFRAFGVSSGSVADNTMPCSVYVITKPGTAEQPVTKVHVQVIEGQATLVELGEQTGTMSLNTDNSAEIQLVCNIVEETVVRVSLPEVSGNVHDFHLNFVATPG